MSTDIITYIYTLTNHLFLQPRGTNGNKQAKHDNMSLQPKKEWEKASNFIVVVPDSPDKVTLKWASGHPNLSYWRLPKNVHLEETSAFVVAGTPYLIRALLVPKQS